MDDQQSPLGVVAVERREIVEGLRHVRERVGQHVVLSFVGRGRTETLELLDGPADNCGVTTKLRFPASRWQDKHGACHFVADGGGSRDIFAMRKALAAGAPDRHNDEQHEYRCQSASYHAVYLAKLVEAFGGLALFASRNAKSPLGAGLAERLEEASRAGVLATDRTCEWRRTIPGRR
jgi:hypothetical protein